MEKSKISVFRLTKIALCAAVLCILGPLSLPIPISEVPVSLSIFGIFLVLIVLGMTDGLISIVIYILLGAVGLPVFSNFSGGFAKLFGPTGGYILGYIPLALIAGYLISKFNRKLVPMVIGMIVGTAACYLLGTVWLMISLKLTFGKALMAGVIPFIPFDLAKLVLSIIVGLPVYKAVKKIEK